MSKYGKSRQDTRVVQGRVAFAFIVRKLDRGELEPQAPASDPDAAALSSDASDPAPF